MKPLDFGDLKVWVFGGWNEIGGNQVLLEAGEGSLLLDFGKPFARWGRLFTEFLSPRSAWGLRDLLFLGLLPPLVGLYRAGEEDTLFPTPLEGALLGGGPDGEKVLALLLSHTHLDHTGAVAYLRQDLPVVATAATAALVKAVQDTSPGGLDGEAAYLSPKTPGAEGALEGDRKRYLRRPYRLLGGGLPGFSALSPAKTKALEGHPWEEASAPLTLGPFRVVAFPVDHSVPGAVAYAVETPEGLVVYTGDLRRHGRWGERTEAFLQGLEGKEVFLLLVEGTRLGRPGGARTEEEIKEALHHQVARHPGVPVAVDFAPRNLERLLACLEVGEDLGRALVVTPKDAYLLHALAEAEPVPWRKVLGKVRVLREGKARRDGWEAWLWEELRPEPVTLEAVAQDPGAYLLAFGFYEVNRLLDLRLWERRPRPQVRAGALHFLQRLLGRPGAGPGPEGPPGVAQGPGLPPPPRGAGGASPGPRPSGQPLPHLGPRP